MKLLSPILFLIFFSGLLLTCSDPVKVGEDSITISIDAAWIEDAVDVDSDGYYSSAIIKWQVTTSEEVNVKFVIGYKLSGTSTYYIYKQETSEHPISGISSWTFSLGDEGHELEEGCYDFSVEVHVDDELVAILTADEDAADTELCMEPAGQEKVEISDISIYNTVDLDDDAYNSSVTFSLTVTTQSAKNLRAYIGYKGSGDANYNTYGLYYSFSANGTESVLITIGTEGHELPVDCYDFIIWIYDENDSQFENLLGSISSIDDSDLALCMETQEEDQTLVTIYFRNNGHILMDFTVNGYGTKSADPGALASFTVTPGVQYYSVYTTGNYKGSDVGLTLTITNDTLNISNSSRTINININADYFYLYYRNDLTVDVYPLTVNYGLSSEITELITIPNDNIQYGLGYYNANINTIIRFYTNYPTEYQYAVQGDHFSFTWDVNQYVSLYSSSSGLLKAVNNNIDKAKTTKNSNTKFLRYEK